MSCVDGYYHVASFGICAKCPPFCPTCSSPNNCSSCAPGYYLNQGICEVCSVANCFSCENAGVPDYCSLCRSGFYLSLGSCQACGANCSICDHHS